MSYKEANSELLRRLHDAKASYTEAFGVAEPGLADYLKDTNVKIITNKILVLNNRIPSMAIKSLSNQNKELAYEVLKLSYEDLYSAGYSGSPYSNGVSGLLGAILRFEIDIVPVNNFFSYAKQGCRNSITNYISSELARKKQEKITYVDGFGSKSSSKIEEPETYDIDPSDTDDNPKLSWQLIANALSRIDLQTKQETLGAIFNYIRRGGSFPSKRELAKELGISANAAYLRMDRAYNSLAEELKREIEPLSYLGTLFVNDIETVRKRFDDMGLEERHRKKDGEKLLDPEKFKRKSGKSIVAIEI